MTPGNKDKRPKKPRRSSGKVPQMSGDFLKTMLDASPTCVFLKDREGRYLLVNRATAELHGTTASAMIGRGDRDYMDVMMTTPVEVDRFLTDDRKVIEEQKPLLIPDEAFTLPDGTVRHFQTTKVPLEVEGHGVCVLGVSVDITARKGAERLLHRERDLAVAVGSATRLEDAFDRVLDAACQIEGIDCGGVYLVDADAQEVRLVSHRGLSRRFVEAGSHHGVGSVQYGVVTAGKPVYGDLAGITKTRRKVLLDEGLRALAVIPVKHEGHVVACLNLASHTRDEIPRVTRDTLETVAAHIGGVIAQVRTREALHESERQYRDLIELAPDSIVTLDLTGRVTSCNAATRAITGYEPDDLLGRHFAKVGTLRAKNIPRYAKLFASILKGNVPPPVELTVNRKDGTACHVEARAAMLKRGDRVVGVQVITRDISERKRAEEALRASEERYRHVVEDMPGLVCRFLPDGTITFVNDEYCRYFGRTSDELVGRDFMRLIPEEDREFVRSQFASLSLDEPRRTYEHRVTAGDGSIRWQRWTDRAVFDPDGRIAEYQSIGWDITERKRAEAGLQESQEKYRRLSEAAFEGMAVHEEGVLLEANDRYFEMFGYEPSEMLGRDHVEMVIPPESIPLVRRRISTRDPGPYQVPAVRKDGTRFLLEVRARAVNYQGREARVVAVRDVTERKRAEEALKEERQRLFSLLDGLPAYVWLQAPDYSPRFVNRTFREHFGDPAGKPCYEVFDRGSKPCKRCPTFRVFETGKPEEWEWTDADSGRTYHVYDYPFAVGDGSPLVLEMGVDITGRKQAEEVLRRRERELRSIFEAASTVAFITTDLAGREARILEFSPGAEHIFGYSREDVLGRPLSMLHLPEDVARFPNVIERMRRTGKPVTGEATLVRKSGERFPALLTTYPVFNDHGEMIGVLGVSTDITDRKRAQAALRQKEEELRQAQKMEAVGRLAGGIAHDFNNLLTAVTGYSELLMQSLAADDPRRQDASEINRAGHEGASLVRQLLVFSRKQVLEPRVLDLNVQLAGMERMLRSVVGGGVKLVTVLEAERPHVKADPVQMEQVMMNLVANARDAMPQGGRLVIETATVELDTEFVSTRPHLEPGAYVMVAVTDTGVGMNEETRSRLFEPFFTTKDVGEGTGLGLSTIYGIVRQSGGDIRVRSEPGRGSTFRIYLPCTRQRPRETAVGEKPAASYTGTETVLVVEDEEAVRQFVVRALRSRGYTVLDAANSREALPLGEHYEEPIDLLLTDVVMPGLTGPELARQIERHRPRMRVLYTSGYGPHAGIPQEDMEPGAAFLQKPFTSEDLARKVREVLDESRDTD